MAFSTTVQAALNRLATYYEGLKAYNAANNPGGFRQGGHLVNFVPALQDVATVVAAVGPMVDAAQAASANSPKALRVDAPQTFTAVERGTARSSLKLPASGYTYVQGNYFLNANDVGTAFYVDATRTITLPLISDCVVGDTVEFFVSAGTLTLAQPAGNTRPIGIPGGGGATISLGAGAHVVKAHGDSTWRVYTPPAADLSTRLLKTGDTMSGALQMAANAAAPSYSVGIAFANASVNFLIRNAASRFQLCDAAGTVEYFSVGTDGTIITRELGNLRGYIDTKFPASSFTGGNVYSALANAGYLQAGASGNTIAFRDGNGRCGFVSGLRDSGGYAMVNNDGRIGRWQVQNGYFEVSVDGAGNFYGVRLEASDERMKENVQPVEGAEESAKIDRLRFVSFDWREDVKLFSGHRCLGIIAQEAKLIEPEWITITQDDKHQPDIYRMLLSTMKALQESNTRVRSLEDRLGALEAR